jgi:hypothetical protein
VGAWGVEAEVGSMMADEVVHDVPSRHFGSRWTEQGAGMVIDQIGVRWRYDATYCILLHAIYDALDNVLNNTSMIPVWLVVAESHHPPLRNVGIPMDFDNTIVDLFPRDFHSAD